MVTHMTDYEIYVFILCLIVFSLLTGLFSYMIAAITRMRLKLIRHGFEDEDIIKEQRKKTGTDFTSVVATIFSFLVCVALLLAFLFSLYMNITRDKAPNGIPSLKVVKSSSMASVNEKNKYLAENDLHDQIQTFDVVVTHHLPKEEDLKLYDIVVYEQDGMYIIHRIVGIEEPNKKHPDCRHFLLQGDAVANPDQFPVLYSQMQGIYQGERIPFVGSFILFMQSPAGWLCILLILFAMIVAPLIEKKIENERKKRLAIGSAPPHATKRENGAYPVGNIASSGMPRTVGFSGGSWSFTFFFLQMKHQPDRLETSDTPCDRCPKRGTLPNNRRK